jgi:hypothetical protein
MAAFLLLSADTDLTLGDIESWAARARALGATATSPVDFGEPPLPADGDHALTLSVPVIVTRTILPGDAPDPSDSATTKPQPSDAVTTRAEPGDAGTAGASPAASRQTGTSELAEPPNGTARRNGSEPGDAEFPTSA